MMKKTVAGVTATAIALIVACGDSKPDPKTPDTTPSSTPVASDTPPVTSSAPVASATPPADAGAPATPPVSANGIPTETKDECTPVGVDFEKRARPKLKDCYATGKKKDPNLQGTVKITVDIDTLGKIKSIKIVEKTLPDPVAQCMLKVVKATPLPDANKCPGKSLSIPVTFPTPH